MNESQSSSGLCFFSSLIDKARKQTSMHNKYKQDQKCENNDRLSIDSLGLSLMSYIMCIALYKALNDIDLNVLE